MTPVMMSGYSVARYLDLHLMCRGPRLMRAAFDFAPGRVIGY